MRKIYEQGLEVVRFSGGELRAFKDEEGRIWVQAKPVAKALGLDWDGQRKHLLRDEVLKDTTVIMTVVSPNPSNPQESIERETIFIERQGLVLWLAKLQPSRVKDPERRQRIIAYQKEAGKALEDYFFRGAAVNPRATVDPELLKAVVSEAVTRALEETRKPREIDPSLERLKIAKEILESAKELPDVDPRWLRRCHEIIFHEATGRALQEEKLTIDLSDFMKTMIGRKPSKGETVSFGQFASKLYREEFGHSPPKRVVMIEGREVTINSFTQDDLPFLERAFRKWAERKKIPIRQDILVFMKEGSRYLN